jgi:hypothetical protein
MGDMTPVIAPKSNELAGDDLIAGPRTITITRVEINPNEEKKASVYYQGDGGKPWRPCKSMARVLVEAWGPDSQNYVGKSVTVYRDPSVTWGGLAVGGVRISHLSHIAAPLKVALTETRGKKVVKVFNPLAIEQAKDKAQEWADKFIADITSTDDVEALVSKSKTLLARLAKERPELHAACEAAISAKQPPEAVDPFTDPFEGPADTQRGEQITLDHALTMLDEAETPADVTNRYDSLKNDFDGDAATALTDRRDECLKALKGGK